MLRIHGLLAARHKGNEGSNLNLSATQSELQRNQAVLLQESLKIAAIPQVLPSNRTGESVPSNPAGKFSGVFLWRAHAQSGFSDSIRRMQCDYMTMMRRKRLDFVKRLGMPFFLTTPFVERYLHPGARLYVEPIPVIMAHPAGRSRPRQMRAVLEVVLEGPRD